MNEKTCKDCPCFVQGLCRLLPHETIIFGPNEYWCYTGRQIMEKEGK